MLRGTFLNQPLSGARGQQEREGLIMQSIPGWMPSGDTCLMGHNKKSTQENPLIDLPLLRACWETTKTTPGCLPWFASFVCENTAGEKRNRELEERTKVRRKVPVLRRVREQLFPKSFRRCICNLNRLKCPQKRNVGREMLISPSREGCVCAQPLLVPCQAITASLTSSLEGNTGQEHLEGQPKKPREGRQEHWNCSTSIPRSLFSPACPTGTSHLPPTPTEPAVFLC